MISKKTSFANAYNFEASVVKAVVAMSEECRVRNLECSKFEQSTLKPDFSVFSSSNNPIQQKKILEKKMVVGGVSH